MTGMPAGDRDGPLLVGYDGSQGAATAIALAANLVPGRHAQVAHLWSPPDGGSALHRRLAHRARTDDHLDTLVAREVAAAAKGVAASGVALAEAVGWTAEPLVRGVYGGEGLELARLAEQVGAAVVVASSSTAILIVGDRFDAFEAQHRVVRRLQLVGLFERGASLVILPGRLEELVLEDVRLAGLGIALIISSSTRLASSGSRLPRRCCANRAYTIGWLGASALAGLNSFVFWSYPTIWYAHRAPSAAF